MVRYGRDVLEQALPLPWWDFVRLRLAKGNLVSVRLGAGGWGCCADVILPTAIFPPAMDIVGQKP